MPADQGRAGLLAPDPSWPTHNRRCMCMGRGWFVEHRCSRPEEHDECVGCVKTYEECIYG